ncbi:MAG: TetR family transcriptional regulator [Clostridia bacterium]|nr:TetR family transcriptional regulator [Clostridia bacterium]
MIRKSTPKEIFAASFKDIARSRSVSKITVQDIVSNCEYSAATFYREFHDKYDLIAWDYAQDVDRIMSQIGHGGDT